MASKGQKPSSCDPQGPQETSSTESLVLQPHHMREELCRTRLEYRRGKKLTAVKVYTIADESTYLLIWNAPLLNGVDVKNDLEQLCGNFGSLDRFESVNTDYNQPFTQTFLAKFRSIVDAIRAKKRLDDYELLGSILHVCYAPEYESMEETLAKLQSRQRYVNIKIAQYKNLLNENKNTTRWAENESRANDKRDRPQEESKPIERRKRLKV